MELVRRGNNELRKGFLRRVNGGVIRAFNQLDYRRSYLSYKGMPL